MRILFALLLLALTVQAKDFDTPDSIDPFHFLAGLGADGEYLRSVDLSACESFYKQGGEQRIADLFVQMAQAWHQRGKLPGTVEYRFQPGGERFAVDDPALGAALRAFYTGSDEGSKEGVHNIEFDQDKRLSYVAGIYARHFSKGLFYGPPTPAMHATVFILLAEGCEVADLVYRQNEVPNIMSFKVKPSDRVARLFALIDNWKPDAHEWKQK